MGNNIVSYKLSYNSDVTIDNLHINPHGQYLACDLHEIVLNKNIDENMTLIINSLYISDLHGVDKNIKFYISLDSSGTLNSEGESSSSKYINIFNHIKNDILDYKDINKKYIVNYHGLNHNNNSRIFFKIKNGNSVSLKDKIVKLEATIQTIEKTCLIL